MFEIKVGGLTFEDDPKRYDRAYVVEPEGLTGWFDGPNTRGSSVERPVSHGAFDLPVFRSARMITVSGNAIASNEVELLKLGQSLIGLLADGESGKFTVSDSDATSWANVRLSGAPKFSPHPSGLEAEFQISFRAADPRRYGNVDEFTGTAVDVHHYGNFPASPVVEVAGPRAAYTVTGPGGRTVQVTQALAAGQSHRIDFRTGRVYKNGVVQVGVLGRTDFWTVPAGRTVPMSISVGSMTVSVADTYI